MPKKKIENENKLTSNVAPQTKKHSNIQETSAICLFPIRSIYFGLILISMEFVHRYFVVVFRAATTKINICDVYSIYTTYRQIFAVIVK